MNRYKNYLYLAFFSFTIFLVAIEQAGANHIVGGEIELVHISGNNYRLRLIQYRDAAQTENTVIETQIVARIFRKSDDRRMRDIVLEVDTADDLDYTNPDCAEDFLKTIKVVYTAELQLTEEEYNAPDGYYVAWERCCRNNSISNIYQEAANTVGMTYYLEFPAVVKNGAPFINSSPTSFPPIRDYACINSAYTVDFRGVDPDGDKLVYSIVTPLDSSTDDAVPVVTPAPHPLVEWKEGFEDIIPGSPDLRITSNGILSVTPHLQGLYVFAVLCEEFRNGEKIGEVRRDFQILVIDCPEQGTPPELAITVLGDETFDPETEVAVLGNDLPEEEMCVEVWITDKENPALSNIEIVPVNFSQEAGEVITISAGEMNEAGDAMMFQVCFSACPVISEAYLLDIIAMDHTCPLPLRDTVRMEVYVEPPDNRKVFFSGVTEMIEETVYAGNNYELPVEMIDEDGDLIELELVAVDFDTSDYQIQLRETASEAGLLRAVYSWDLLCRDFDFGTENEFTLKFIANDLNPCDLGDADTLTLTLHVEDLPASFDELSVPNVFTPNGDGKNDFFQMCDNDQCENRFVLPPDNCQGQFESITIFNRWGKQVYTSETRDFAWDGGDLETGAYYYLLKYTHKKFKGALSLIR